MLDRNGHSAVDLALECTPPFQKTVSGHQITVSGKMLIKMVTCECVLKYKAVTFFVFLNREYNVCDWTDSIWLHYCATNGLPSTSSMLAECSVFSRFIDRQLLPLECQCASTILHTSKTPWNELVASSTGDK